MSWDDLDLLSLQITGYFFISRETIRFPRMTVLHERCFCPDITANCILSKHVSVQNVLFSLSLSEVQAKLRGTFARLTEALQAREKQLLRQVEVLHSQQVALLQSQSSVPSSCIT